jgi:hypothetical protein
VIGYSIEGVEHKHVVCIGFGVNTFHGVCHAQAFRSIKGVARLLAEMLEIGTISNKAASKLAGLAPFPFGP